MATNVLRFVKGSVWWYSRTSEERGITHGDHPCVIISSNEWNEKASSVIIIPCTSAALTGTLISPKLKFEDTEGVYFPSQITTIPKANLYHYMGQISAKEVKIIEEAVKSIVTGNKPNQLSDNIYIKSQESMHSSPMNSKSSENSYDYHKHVYNVKDRNAVIRKPSITIRTNKQIRKHGDIWTFSIKQQFINEIDEAKENDWPLDDICSRYDISKSSVSKYFYLFKTELGV